jgi:hypothetical protein
MKRHYKCTIVFTNNIIECFVPIDDRAFYDIKDQVANWLISNYRGIKRAYIIQKSSKRRVNEQVI